MIIVLDVNKPGEARVVICYNNEDLRGESIYLATNRLYWEERRMVFSDCLRPRVSNFYKDTKQNPRIRRSRPYRSVHSDQTIGAEFRQAFKDLLQWVYSMANKIPQKLSNLV